MPVKYRSIIDKASVSCIRSPSLWDTIDNASIHHVEARSSVSVIVGEWVKEASDNDEMASVVDE